MQPKRFLTYFFQNVLIIVATFIFFQMWIKNTIRANFGENLEVDWTTPSPSLSPHTILPSSKHSRGHAHQSENCPASQEHTAGGSFHCTHLQVHPYPTAQGNKNILPFRQQPSSHANTTMSIDSSIQIGPQSSCHRITRQSCNPRCHLYPLETNFNQKFQAY